METGILYLHMQHCHIQNYIIWRIKQWQFSVLLYHISELEGKGESYERCKEKGKRMVRGEDSEV